MCTRLDVFLRLVVEDQHERGRDRADVVGHAASEEAARALGFHDVRDGRNRAVELDRLRARLHHEPSPDRVDGVREDRGRDVDGHREREFEEDARVLAAVLEENHLPRVVEAKVSGAVDDDADDGDGVAAVEAPDALLGSNLPHDVGEAARELLDLAHVRREARVAELEGVDDRQTRRARRAARHEVAREPAREPGLFFVGHERLLVLLLAREVDGLRREVPRAVRQVAAPERPPPLVGHDALGRADHRARARARLQHDFHALQRRAEGLGQAARRPAQREVLRELGDADAALGGGHDSFLV
mmetsp:Transcript_31946/g.95963  ORF Transcript_31946/g.95963 Transcript_31946/m.95963 type:complete len:302 (+) Transcript_31946:30-935(+)